jgi:hypothetical protein
MNKPEMAKSNRRSSLYSNSRPSPPVIGLLSKPSNRRVGLSAGSRRTIVWAESVCTR